MQRAGVESILGLRIAGDVLGLDPRIPKSWPHFEISLRQGGAHYDIRVENPSSVQSGIASATLDDATISVTPFAIDLIRDGVLRRIHLVMG